MNAKHKPAGTTSDGSKNERHNMVRSKSQHQKTNSEIDRRLLEMQSPREIVRVLRTATLSNVHARAKRMDMALHRITPAERDHLLVRRKEGSK
jgi:hypothetical protein